MFNVPSMMNCNNYGNVELVQCSGVWPNASALLFWMLLISKCKHACISNSNCHCEHVSMGTLAFRSSITVTYSSHTELLAGQWILIILSCNFVYGIMWHKHCGVNKYINRVLHISSSHTQKQNKHQAASWSDQQSWHQLLQVLPPPLVTAFN